MKFADSVKQLANLTSTATITPGAAAVGFRTWAQAIADTAGKPEQVAVGDTVCNRVEDVTDPSKWEIADYTIGGTAQAPTLTRGTIRTSSAGGAAVVFGGPVTVLGTVDANWLAGLVLKTDSTTVNALTDATLADTQYVMITDTGGNAFRSSLAALKSYLGVTAGSGGATADTTAPVMTGSIATSNVASTSLTMTYPAGTDNVGITEYDVSIDTGMASWVTNGTNLSYGATGLTANTPYTLRARAKDAAGNVSNVLTASITTAAAAAASTYTVRQTNATGGVNGTNFLTTGTINGGSATTDGYAGFTPAVYILDANGNAPANGTSILFAWGASPTVPPTLTADVPPRVAVGQMHNAAAEGNTTAAAAPQGGWAAKGDGYYGLYSTGASFFVYTEKPGTAVNAYLWTQVGSTWVVFTDTTGTPIPYVLT